jgi:succinate dehydrogenase / fumarate reductase iron-sulfur subunit
MTHPESFQITLMVSRSEADKPTSFSVPIPSKNSRVLDALLHVRHNIDPSLGFRYSCRAGMCGSCAVVINGKEGLACQTTIGSLNTDVIRISPMKGLPIIRDVMCDMDPFFNTLINANAAMVSKEPNRDTLHVMPPNEPKRRLIQRQNGCITCGACFSACEWSSTREGYLGPSAMNRVLMLALDERDALGKERLKTVANENGIFRCHSIGNCSQVCPAEIPLQQGMSEIKGLLSGGVE